MTSAQHQALRALCLLSVDGQWATAVEAVEVDGAADPRTAGNALAKMARHDPPLVEVRRADGSSRNGGRVTRYRPTAIGREVVRLAEGEGDPEMRQACAAERMRLMRVQLELLADGWERAGARGWEIGCVLERAAADRPYRG